MDLITIILTGIGAIATIIGVYITYKQYKPPKTKEDSNFQPEKSQKPPNSEKLKKYLTWLKEKFSSMDTEKLQGRGQAIPLSLPEIFIPLYANDPKSEQVREIEGKKEKISEQREKPVDIERLIDKNEYLVIEGQAGSGKTTLLKHFTYSLA